MSRDAKTSNIEWIGQIPKTWNTNKVKYVTKCMDGKRVPVDASQRTPGPYPYWGAGSITDHVDKFLFDEELVLLGEDGAPFFDKTRNVAFLINEKVWINNHIHVLKPQKNIDASFLCYALNSVDYREYINGAIINKLTQSDMKTINIPYPPLPEQHQIVSFLDRKCSAIDTAIEKTKKSIEKLEEYKKAVITKAVTKGLDPDAKMKDSGIEWIGEVPETWDVKRIKYACLERKEKKIFKDAPNRYIGLENVESYTGHFIETESTYLPGVYDVCYENDILFGKLRPYLAKVIMAPYEAACTGEFLIIKNFVGEIKFLFYWLANKEFVKAVDVSTYGAKMPRANTEFIMNLPICLPSDKEQQQILSYLDDKCASIDVLISKKQDAINKWEEYKKSLIYYAVTGKIDCRNEVI